MLPRAESTGPPAIGPPLRSAAALEFRQHARALIAAMIGLCVGLPGLSNYGFSVFIAPLTHEFGWSIPQVSAWVFFLMIGSCVSSILLGNLVDRLGARRVILLAMPLFAGALAAAGLMTGELWQLRAVAFTAGAIGPGVSLLAYSQAVNERFDVARGTALGIMTAGIGISSVIAPPLMQRIVDAFGWRTGFAFMGAAALFAFPFTYRWLTAAREGRVEVPRPVLAGLSCRAALDEPRFWLISAIAFAVGVYSAGVIFNLLPFLTESGIARSTAASYLGLFGLFMVIGKLICGLSLDRFAVNRIGALILVAQAAALLWLGRFADGSVAVAIAIIGFSTGGQIALSTYTIPRYLGMKSYGQVYGIVSIVNSLGVGVGPYFFSMLRESTESYRLSLLVAAALALLSGALYACLGRQR
jgi:predicted MFS family arabinose efflux permease